MIKGDWVIKNEKQVYENNWIAIEHSEVITPGGSDGVYGVVRFKNLAVGILPIDDDGFTWLVGQYRFPLEEYSWEIPEGGAPFDEDPTLGARRELLEEVGVICETLEPLLELRTSNSVTDEKAIVYLAEGLSFEHRHPEDTENLEVQKIHFSELFEKTMAGEILDAISVAAILKLAHLRPSLCERPKN